MMTSSNGNLFGVTGPLCGKFSGHLWISLTKASDTENLMFSVIYAWKKGWINSRVAGDLRRHGARYYITVMISMKSRVCAASTGTHYTKSLWIIDPNFEKHM